MPLIEFANKYVPQNTIDIPELGNFALEAINEDDGFYYYLLIKTKLGTSSVVSFGPIIPDIKLLPDNYVASYQKIQFKDVKMKIFVDKWLNDTKKKITTASVITEDELLNNYRDIKTYIESYSEELY